LDLHSRNAGVAAWLTPLLLVAVCVVGDAAAQTIAEKPPSGEVTAEVVQDRLKQVEESTNLDEATKGRLRELCQQALKDLETAKDWAAAAAQFEQKTVSAPEELTTVTAQLQALPRRPMALVPQASLLQLEQTLSEKESELKAKKEMLAECEAEPQRRASRRVEIPKLAVEATQRLAELDRQLQAPSGGDEPFEAAEVRKVALLARRKAMELELASYQKELKAYEARAELLPLRRDLMAAEIAMAEKELATWRVETNRQRQRDADNQLRRAQSEAEQADPATAALAKRTAALAERRKAVAQSIVKTTQQLEDANQKLAALKDQFTRIQGKVDAVGLTNAVGLLLRKQRETLPNLRTYRRALAARQASIGETQLELLQLEDRRSELANPDAVIAKELLDAGLNSRDGGSHELEAAARSALATEKEYVDALSADINAYFDKLVDLDSAETQLIEETERYAKYVDERVLWIRSAPAVDADTLPLAAQAAAWLVNPEAWLGLLLGLGRDVTANPFFPALFAIVVGPWIWSQRRLRRKVTAIGELADRANCCSMVPTFQAIAWSTVIAAFWPGVLLYVSWRLTAGAESSEFSKAVGGGLAYTAGVYLFVELFRQMCRGGGLAETHFDWPLSALRPLRSHLLGAVVLILPCAFVAMTMAWQENERWSDSLGRLNFIAAMLACGLLLQRLLRPTGSIYQAVFAARRTGWIHRLRLAWYPLAVTIPLALAMLAAVGYYYTSAQLARRLVTSAYILLGLTLLRSVLLRGVLVRRRKLAIAQARQRRAATNQADPKEATEASVPSAMPAPAEANLDLAAINAQTRHFVEYSLAVTGCLGIWLVWIDVLPALRIFNEIVLWQIAEQADPITLADLFQAILIFVTTVISAKNIPGLLQMTVLERLPLDAGLRYTIGAVSRYLIVVVGLVLGCHAIGLSWAKVQWLVAAVSVGLGFGLQEIFANFVSGLIILFERPVRVGDVVTVDDVTGVISRIRMRATTITNWDRKEFIVPNKEFITGRLLNWTLSDQVNRVVINVGIAYGSDTALAAELLMKVASGHPGVLDDPAPQVTFEEFGESTLNFVVRCYLPDLENRLRIIHDLHMGIDREFRGAGIEIAFPQHDVHIRTVLDQSGVLDRLLPRSADGPFPQENNPRDAGVRKAA
jgi:potassium efflux system protein